MKAALYCTSASLQDTEQDTELRNKYTSERTLRSVSVNERGEYHEESGVQRHSVTKNLKCAELGQRKFECFNALREHR